MTWPAALLLALVAGSLAGAEITLESGSVVEGEIVSESASEVRLRLSQGGNSAERTWPKSEIVRIVRGPSARQQAAGALRAEADALAGTAAAASWLQLARRARSLDEPALARTLAIRAVQRDRTLVEAQRLLGRDEVHGIWMRPGEAAAARGLVLHEGRWMPWPERERLRAVAAERRKRQQEAQDERRRALAERAAAQEPALDVDLPQRWSYTPSRVLWWGSQPRTPCPTAGYPGPVLRVGASGRWGGVDWNLRLNW